MLRAASYDWGRRCFPERLRSLWEEGELAVEPS